MNIVLARGNFDPVLEQGKGHGVVVHTANGDGTIVYPLTGRCLLLLLDCHLWKRVELFPLARFFVPADRDAIELLQQVLPEAKIVEDPASEVPAPMQLQPFCRSCKPNCKTCGFSPCCVQ